MENTNTVVENAERPLIFTRFDEYVSFNEAKKGDDKDDKDDKDDEGKKKKKDDKKKSDKKPSKKEDWNNKKVPNKDKKIADDKNKEVSKEFGSFANLLHTQLLKDGKIAKMTVDEVKDKFTSILNSKDLKASKGKINGWKALVAKAKSITGLQGAIYNIYLKADGLGVNESISVEFMDEALSLIQA
jgi:hypothetical protein